MTTTDEQATASRNVLIPLAPNIANELSRNPRTIKRWIRDPEMNFPPTILIGSRLYVTRSAFEEWKAQKAAETEATLKAEVRANAKAAAIMASAKAEATLATAIAKAEAIMAAARIKADAIRSRAGAAAEAEQAA